MNVDSAYNGKDAIDKVIQQNSGTSGEDVRFQLIFMDCQMPVMDGYQATEKLKGLARITGDIPIIGCTAFTAKSRIDDCFQSGMIDVINKPVSREKVLKVIQKHMKQIVPQLKML